MKWDRAIWGGIFEDLCIKIKFRCSSNSKRSLISHTLMVSQNTWNALSIWPDSHSIQSNNWGTHIQSCSIFPSASSSWFSGLLNWQSMIEIATYGWKDLFLSAGTFPWTNENLCFHCFTRRRPSVQTPPAFNWQNLIEIGTTSICIPLSTGFQPNRDGVP